MSDDSHSGNSRELRKDCHQTEDASVADLADLIGVEKFHAAGAFVEITPEGDTAFPILYLPFACPCGKDQTAKARETAEQKLLGDWCLLPLVSAHRQSDAAHTR